MKKHYVISATYNTSSQFPVHHLHLRTHHLCRCLTTKMVISTYREQQKQGSPKEQHPTKNGEREREDCELFMLQNRKVLSNL